MKRAVENSAVSFFFFFFLDVILRGFVVLCVHVFVCKM